jgi:phenylacetate-CoA ligase
MSKFKEALLIDGIFPISDLFFHTHINYWYKYIGKMLSWKPEAVLAWQTRKITELVKDAYSFSPYYHQLFQSLSLVPDDIRTIQDLEMIPPLTKDIIRERYDDIILHGKRGLTYRHYSTGGSTGNPTRYVKDNNSWGFDNAFNIHMWKQTGYHYGDRFLALGSSSLFPVNKKSHLHDFYYQLKGKIPFNSMNMSEEVLKDCVTLIREKNIHYIYGYASSLFILAKYVQDQHLQDMLDIRACFPTSEILTPLYRSTIERVFGCVVSDMYGAHDGGIVAHNISGGYKVGYNCIVQTLDGTQTGTALLTDVTSTSFPFIRYQLGDELSIGKGYNETYFNGQVLDSVIGRSSDIILLENGHTLTGPGFTILFSKLNIKGYRLYKSGPMEITVEVVKTDAYDAVAEDKLIVETIWKHAGSECHVNVKYVDKVENRKNGKNLFFLNAKE